MRFLAIGECMAELSPTDNAGQYALGFAGDTFNTAWYLARMASDIDVSFYTAVGDDKMSDDMLAFMQTSGIDTSGIQRRAGDTVGLYAIHLENGERSFSYWRGQSAAKKLADDYPALALSVEAVDVIYFSGITLAILSPPGRANLLGTLADAKAEGKKVVFDPNLRPRLWPSVDVMRQEIMCAAQHATTILPSFEDERDCFADAAPRSTIERYAAAGVPTVVVKNGKHPVEFLDVGICGSVTPQETPSVVDTTAAGDSFNAGFLAACFRGVDTASAIEAGCRLSAKVIQQKGALTPV